VVVRGKKGRRNLQRKKEERCFKRAEKKSVFVAHLETRPVGGIIGSKTITPPGKRVQ